MILKIKKILIKIPGFMPLYHSIRKLINFPSFLRDFQKFKKLSEELNRSFSIKYSDLFPCLLDKTKKTPFEPHYTYHPAWAARIIKKINPEFHTDISSSINFVTVLSAFIATKFYDFRPAYLNLDNLESNAADLNSLHFEDNSINSLSCLHVVEHVGLGRYGDKLDPHGDIKAMKELERVLAKNGSLLFVVPVGKPRIAFNAHRIYSYEQIVEKFSQLELKEFSLIPDNFKDTGIIYNADPELVKKQDWGCGCFWFIKK